MKCIFLNASVVSMINFGAGMDREVISTLKSVFIRLVLVDMRLMFCGVLAVMSTTS
jgi:hypothetical protein